MASYQILYWYDIPIQVRAWEAQHAGDRPHKRVSKPLPQRFQAAIDKAAMEAGLTGDDAYMDTYRWNDRQERPGSAQEVAEAVAAELEAAFSTIDWHKTAAALKHGK
ncbi:MAG: virulence factor [Anaerolineales bacterium]|jgi:hypothetical protein